MKRREGERKKIWKFSRRVIFFFIFPKDRIKQKIRYFCFDYSRPFFNIQYSIFIFHSLLTSTSTGSYISSLFLPFPSNPFSFYLFLSLPISSPFCLHPLLSPLFCPSSTTFYSTSYLYLHIDLLRFFCSHLLSLLLFLLSSMRLQ